MSACATQLSLLDQIDPGLGLMARDAGLKKATKHSDPRWTKAATDWVDALETGDHFTADDLVECVGLPCRSGPKRNNAVGAFIRGMAVRGLVSHTGRTVKAGRVRSHARRILVWEKA